MRRVLVGVALVLALAGCSGDDGGGVATAGGNGDSGAGSSQTPADDEEARQKFAQCMRDNGVDMPDPEPGERPRMELNGDRAKVEKAMDECRDLLPNGGNFNPSQEDIEAMQKMADCMRDNGVPEFPDPDPEGGIRIQRDSGIDPQDPTFQAAQEKCREFMPERGPQGGGNR